MGAQERMVRVTLLEGPTDDPTSSVRISGGQVSPLDAIATNISINPADPAMQQPFNKDENVQVYGRRDGPLQNIDMHQTVIYELSMKDDERTTLMPMGVFKIQFGDVDIKPGMSSAVNPRVTYEAERLRVANNWGGYGLFPYVRHGQNGAVIADTRKISAPRVPHVSMVEVDQRGNAVGEELDIWKFYRWETSVDRQAAAEAKRRAQSDGYFMEDAPTTVTVPAGQIDPAHLEKLIAEAVEKRLAQGKKAQPSG